MSSYAPVASPSRSLFPPKPALDSPNSSTDSLAAILSSPSADQDSFALADRSLSANRNSVDLERNMLLDRSQRRNQLLGAQRSSLKRWQNQASRSITSAGHHSAAIAARLIPSCYTINLIMACALPVGLVIGFIYVLFFAVPKGGRGAAGEDESNHSKTLAESLTQMLSTAIASPTPTALSTMSAPVRSQT